MPLPKKRLTTQQIYQDLWQQIVNFDLFPGSRVTETELAETYQTSRTPIREALKRLEVEGLVNVRPKQGCFIRPVDMGLISDYYMVRVALEAMAVELACQHMTDEELQALADVWSPEAYRKQRKDLEHIKEIEEDFHIRIARGSGNPILLKYLEDANNRIRPIRLLGFPDEKSIVDTYKEHYEIITLIQQRDVEKARQAMTEHISKSQGIARTVTLAQLEQYRRKFPRKRR
jgi:DNA-binding GntR family transcriptional regulator